MNKNRNKTGHNLQDAAKALWWGKGLATEACLKKPERAQSDCTTEGTRKRRANEAQSQVKERSNRDQSGK